jgi:hypothetical protein
VGDVIVDGPTHKAVEVFGQSLVAPRDKDFSAFAALMNGCSTFDYFSLDSTGSKHQIERLFMSCGITGDPLSFFPLCHLRPTARRALPITEHDTLIDSHFPVPESLGLPLMLLQDPFCADVHALPLVIKMGAIINVLEVRMEELFLSSSINRPELINFFHRCDSWDTYIPWLRMTL